MLSHKITATAHNNVKRTKKEEAAERKRGFDHYSIFSRKGLLAQNYAPWTDNKW